MEVHLLTFYRLLPVASQVILSSLAKDHSFIRIVISVISNPFSFLLLVAPIELNPVVFLVICVCVHVLELGTHCDISILVVNSWCKGPPVAHFNSCRLWVPFFPPGHRRWRVVMNLSHILSWVKGSTRFYKKYVILNIAAQKNVTEYIVLILTERSDRVVVTISHYVTLVDVYKS